MGVKKIYFKYLKNKKFINIFKVLLNNYKYKVCIDQKYLTDY